AAVEGQPSGVGAGTRDRAGNRNTIRHAALHDVAIKRKVSRMKITVLMGGTSSERNVSLASGIRIVQALRSRGDDVTPLDPARGVISGAEERELSTGKVGAEPPSLDSLSKFAEETFLPNLTGMKEIKGADVVFLALHGGQGEDGTLQALLDMANVRYTGSGHLSSALAMDKD